MAENEASTEAGLQHADCVTQSACGALNAMCGLEVVPLETDPEVPDGPICMAVISLVGDLSWSIYLALPKDMAEQAVQRFCGMEIPFDSEDMSDAVGELTNIFVGQVKAALDQRGVDVEISLPSVLRAQQLQVVAHSKGKKLSQAYNTECGPMWTGIIVGES